MGSEVIDDIRPTSRGSVRASPSPIIAHVLVLRNGFFESPYHASRWARRFILSIEIKVSRVELDRVSRASSCCLLFAELKVDEVDLEETDSRVDSRILKSSILMNETRCALPLYVFTENQT